MSTKKIARKLRARREMLEFERALRSASPGMRSDLIAAAARTDIR